MTSITAAQTINKESTRTAYYGIESIKIHAKMTSGVHEVPFYVVKKSQDKLRSTASDGRGLVSFTTLLNNDTLFNITNIQSNIESSELSGDEAAAQLFDLLMLNPEYHFRKQEGFPLNSKIFSRYHISFDRTKHKNASFQEHIIGAKLFKNDTDSESKILIRSVQITNFRVFKREINEPEQLSYTDEESGETTEVTITGIDYNIGIGDFIFDTPQ